jgi:hypothetical protein
MVSPVISPDSYDVAHFDLPKILMMIVWRGRLLQRAWSVRDVVKFCVLFECTELVERKKGSKKRDYASIKALVALRELYGYWGLAAVTGFGCR